MDVAQVGATWLHLLATVALLGYYAIVGIVVLPAIRAIVSPSELAASIAAVHQRATPVILGSLAIFIATGIYLMTTDSQSAGIGNVTGSTWATLFLVKHLVVGAMVGLGVYIDALVVRRFALPDSIDRPGAVRRLAVSTAVMTALGAAVLLLTAVGQLS